MLTTVGKVFPTRYVHVQHTDTQYILSIMCVESMFMFNFYLISSQNINCASMDMMDGKAHCNVVHSFVSFINRNTMCDVLAGVQVYTCIHESRFILHSSAKLLRRCIVCWTTIKRHHYQWWFTIGSSIRLHTLNIADKMHLNETAIVIWVDRQSVDRQSNEQKNSDNNKMEQILEHNVKLHHHHSRLYCLGDLKENAKKMRIK